MTTLTTPVYGIAYVDGDSALPDLAAATQAAAQTTEAALLRGGVVPPAAADLNAVTARVVTLENARTTNEGRISALETKTTRTPQSLALSSSFAAYGIAPFTEGSGLTMWKDALGSVRIVGLLKPAAAIGTAAAVAVLGTTGGLLPAGFRPPASSAGAAQTFIRYIAASGGPGVAVVWHRVSILSTGALNFEASVALAAGNTPLMFDLSFPTTN